MTLTEVKSALQNLVASANSVEQVVGQLLNIVEACSTQNHNNDDPYTNVYNYSMALKSHLLNNNRGMVASSYNNETMAIMMPAICVQRIVTVAALANGYVVALPGMKDNEFTISLAAANSSKQILPSFYTGPMANRQPCQQAWLEKVKGNMFTLPTPQ
jgi:hypothetical protein